MARLARQDELIARRTDGILTRLRKGECTLHELADLVCLHPDYTKAAYLIPMIAKGMLHISRAVRGPTHARSNAYPIYAWGPPPEGTPLCHKAQASLARAAIDDLPRESSLTPILQALEFEDLTLDDLVVATGFCRSEIRKRLVVLIELGDIHVKSRIRLPHKYFGVFVYAIGPGHNLPYSAADQHKRAVRAFQKHDVGDQNRKRHRLRRQTSRADPAAAWLTAPIPTEETA